MTLREEQFYMRQAIESDLNESKVDKVIWYLNRIKAMSIMEINWRIT